MLRLLCIMAVISMALGAVAEGVEGVKEGVGVLAVVLVMALIFSFFCYYRTSKS